MRVLLVVCLLVGSISSLPVWQEQGVDAPGQGATSHMVQTGSERVESSGPGSSSSLPNLASPSFSPRAGGYATGFDGSGGSYGAGSTPGGGGGYAYGPAGAYDGSGGSYGAGYEAGSHGGAGWSAGSSTYDSAGDENSGPIFSDVSDLDPVYGFSSRSRYQRGRAVFAQSRYTPGELLAQPIPQYVPVIKNPVMLNIPVQEPVQLQEPVKAPQIPAKAQMQQGY
ncbi:uncharacterized protein LOC141796823 [Halichoeres trimaculatus]|uniref:uncharacterized protein LOC141796823 n=1 Tax=Halichoeres trimaculatus TaxID=147232 RepID=UPI003D9F9F15